MRIHLLTARTLCAAALTLCGCGAQIQASVAYDSAHDIQSKAGLAQADLKMCKADTTKCDQLDQDLNAILETSTNLEKKAQDAGFNPGVTQTPAPSPTKN